MAGKRKIGRPTTFTPTVGQEICERISSGELVKDVCASLGIPRFTLSGWVDRNPEFATAYARAREMQADAHFDLAIQSAREATPENAQAARVKMDAEKWAAAKLRPHAYGDRQQTEITGANGGPVQMQAITIDPTDLTPEQRLVLRQALTAVIAREQQQKGQLINTSYDDQD
jgi:hypothetical protein